MEQKIPRTGNIMNAYIILLGKPLGKCPLRRLRKRCEDNIKIELREIDEVGRRVKSALNGWWCWTSGFC
jgi:hypothetical protein